jgi:hypothetical protein
MREHSLTGVLVSTFFVLMVMLVATAVHGQTGISDKALLDPCAGLSSCSTWVQPVIRVLPRSGEATISAAPRPECEGGWTLVMDAGMQPMCARELRKPR